MPSRLATGIVSLVVVVVLCAAAPAGADVFDEYQELSQRDLNPTPLVPTSVPRSLEPVEMNISRSSSRRRSGYALVIAAFGSDPLRATARVAFSGGDFPTMASVRREARRGSYSIRKLRVRGHSGYLLKRNLGGQRTLWLLWPEGGRIYSLATGTLKTVSQGKLLKMAADLEPLGRDYIGSDESGEQSGLFVTTKNTVTGGLEWTAQCTTPEGAPRTPRAAGARITWLRVRGGTFSYEIAPNLVRDATGWSGTISGTVTPDAITINFRATGTIDGTLCDTGPVTMTLDQRSRF